MSLQSTTAEPAEEAPLGTKHEPPAAGNALIKRAPLPKAVAAHVLSDDEMRRTWRLSSALAASGMFKDGDSKTTAEIAFAKILIGRDLGISATRALAGIDIVRGNVQMRGVLLLAFVRESRRYDYKIVELDGETEVEGTVDVVKREAKQRATLRFFEVLPDGTKEALTPDITFTMAMARKQGNVKEKSPWYTARRNMLLWRAASDGVKFHCPDLLGGVPVYTEADDIPAAPQQLGDGTGDGQPAGLDLGPEVEAVIKRGTELECADLSESARGVIELLLGDQPPAKVVEWVKAANKRLDAIPSDAEVVAGEPVEGHESPAASQTTEHPSEPQDAPQASAAGHEAVQSAVAVDSDQVEGLRRRGEQLLADAEAAEMAGRTEEADALHEEFAIVAAQVEAAEDPSQGRMAI